MKILALDFSSPRQSVALVEKLPTPGSWKEYEVAATGSRSSTPFAMIAEVLKQGAVELEHVEGLAIGLGPGSYTGIRGTIALAQGWQLGRGVNLQGLSSAECLAAQAHAEGLTGRIAVVIDAQRREVYLANYELAPEGWREVQPLRLASQSEVKNCEDAGELLLGPEVTKWFPRGRVAFPRATALGKLALSQADYVSGEKLEPIYLRKTTFVKAPPPRVLPGELSK
jgi:tRNA threonylcarbamoyl adenosine modification protein YeaZ